MKVNFILSSSAGRALDPRGFKPFLKSLWLKNMTRVLHHCYLKMMT
uniref:Uncharacterized protein n=1 Tax=Anguilla anguilla TaxID=7936 RepID=A0A0E9UVV2_ANGAN